MTERVFNFGAGPAVLPEPVLAEMQHDLLALPGVGISVLEISHRSKAFVEIIESAEANIRSLVDLSDDYHVLFLQGGSTMQFSMVPMNLLPPSGSADYIVTGAWAKKAADEAGLFGAVRQAATTEADGFSQIPDVAETNCSADAAYLHVTSNNTIVGTQWVALPDSGQVPLVVDSSSDVFSRPLDFEGDGIALLYAGAQKNLGPAGVTLVIIRNDLVERASSLGRIVPTMLRYATYARSGSLYNTPPVFAIYVLWLVTKWLIANGGLAAMADRNDRKARKLYDAIDCTDFYRGTAAAKSRSKMNVTMRLPSTELEEAFVAEAQLRGLSGLKGHRSVGGVRASIYNAFPEMGVDALVEFMSDFERVHG